jgi:hypothetical protein
MLCFMVPYLPRFRDAARRIRREFLSQIGRRHAGFAMVPAGNIS